MKKIIFILTIMVTSSCGYKAYDQMHKDFITNENIPPEKVQFYNANRIVLWNRNKEQDVDNKLLDNSGKIEFNKSNEDLGNVFKKNLGWLVKSDNSNTNILYVITDKDQPNKTLKFMRLSEVSKEVREEFIKLYRLQNVPLLEELYYLVPEKITKERVHKKIRTKSKILRKLQPKWKQVYCGETSWGKDNYQLYFNHPTFLMISKKDDKRYRINIKKHKGNYIKDNK
tara:strand:- start:17732 stop:18412 length:681 start_codon:yes stop_codon:yes gene_type:complete